jgi:hypothetical protein
MVKLIDAATGVTVTTCNFTAAMLLMDALYAAFQLNLF